MNGGGRNSKGERIGTIGMPGNSIEGEDEGIDRKFKMRYNSNGVAVRQPELVGTTVEERTESLLKEYGWNNYQERVRLSSEIGIKTEFAVCLAQSETGIGGQKKSAHNLFNCGNTDSGKTSSYNDFEDGFRKLGSRCLNGTYLKKKTTLSHLYPNHKESICNKEREEGCRYIYASSPENAGNNVMNCLGNIYQKQINMDYQFRI